MSVRDLGVCQECGKRATRTASLWVEETRLFARVELCKKCWRAHQPEPTPLKMPLKAPKLFLLLKKHNTDPDLDLIYYQIMPIASRAGRVAEAWVDYYGEDDEANTLFFETECLEQQLLLAHRCIQWKPIGKAWEWCQEVLAYLSARHGFKLQIPDHLPLL